MTNHNRTRSERPHPSLTSPATPAKKPNLQLERPGSDDCSGYGQFAVTVTFNSKFVGAGVAGSPVYATGRVVRETTSMVFP
jgi:hypothetical protein